MPLIIYHQQPFLGNCHLVNIACQVQNTGCHWQLCWEGARALDMFLLRLLFWAFRLVLLDAFLAVMEVMVVVQPGRALSGSSRTWPSLWSSVVMLFQRPFSSSCYSDVNSFLLELPEHCVCQLNQLRQIPFILRKSWASAACEVEEKGGSAVWILAPQAHAVRWLERSGWRCCAACWLCLLCTAEHLLVFGLWECSCKSPGILLKLCAGVAQRKSSSRSWFTERKKICA